MLLNNEQIIKAVKVLQKEYPGTKTALAHHSAWELLISVILSAQCTDARVNMVTPVLFKKYPGAAALAKADVKDVEKIIYSTGFYRAKAKSIMAASDMIVTKFGGKVPGTMEELLTLRGVARKTANVVLSDFFHKTEGIVVDTHVKRVSFRLGFTKETDPVKVERDLMKKTPQKYWIWLGNAFVWHGRKICDARTPRCSVCPAQKLCPKNGIKKSS